MVFGKAFISKNLRRLCVLTSIITRSICTKNMASATKNTLAHKNISVSVAKLFGHNVLSDNGSVLLFFYVCLVFFSILFTNIKRISMCLYSFPSNRFLCSFWISWMKKQKKKQNHNHTFHIEYLAKFHSLHRSIQITLWLNWIQLCSLFINYPILMNDELGGAI